MFKNIKFTTAHYDYVRKQPVAWKEYCAEYWLKEPEENMDRCTDHRDIIEILLKTALNTIKSINHIIPPGLTFYHTIQTFNDHKEEGFGKHYGKRRKCW